MTTHQIFLKDTTNDTRKLVASHYPNAILELLNEGVFKPDEISKEIIPPILNEYHKMHVSLNRILYQREHGDYGYERQFLPTPENVPTTSLDSPQKQNPLLLSEFIDKFIQTKIDDGRWTERNLPTHKSHIINLIYILGDIPVVSIDRQQMRNFRDILTKLPTNRTRDKRYKDKTLSELLEMDIDSSLNIKTVNTIIETISGMFEWGIREELVDKNPAKDLTLKDERQKISLRDPFTDDDIKKIFFLGNILQRVS